jgi:8-oxo-dGTP diphosphatase
MTERIDVVAAVVRRQDDAILLARRAVHQHQGGKWELPGGKVELGENLLRALSRELGEELGVRCNLASPLMTIEHDYPDKSVRLHFFEVRDWLGDAQGREGQLLDWVMPADLTGRDFPEANLPLVKALMLGSQLLIWPDKMPDNWEVRLHLALQRGVNLVYARGVAEEPILEQMRIVCRQHSAKLLLADDIDLMRRVGADGLHLKAATAALHDVRPDVELLSVACHSQKELRHALALGADMVLLAPVQPTVSHPEAAPLGWQQFASMAQGLPMPIFALGGVGPADLPQARAHGAWGVAGISGFWPPAQLLHP